MKDKKSRRSKAFYVVATVALLTAGGIARLTAGDGVAEKSSAKITVSSRAQSTTSSRYTVPLESSTAAPTSSAESKAAESSSVKSEVAAKAEPLTFAMPIKGNIIKQFSNDTLLYSKTHGDMRVHCGIDIAAETGAKVKASGNGTVEEVVDDKINGKTVVINHGDNIKSYYCGLNDASVKKGDKVTMSKVIGTVGEMPAECLDDSHLHFAICRDGNWVSPLQAMGLE